MLISLHRGVMFMVRRRFLRRVFLILQKYQLIRGLTCNQFMPNRHRIELVGATKKVTFLFFHQEKLQIWWKTIWIFFFALVSKLTTKMILHQRTSLNSKGNIKGIYKKVVRYGNKRVLNVLIRRKMFRIISCVFWNYTQEEVLKTIKIELFLFLFPVGYLNVILIPETNKVLKYPLDLGGFMKWVGCWFYM